MSWDGRTPADVVTYQAGIESSASGTANVVRTFNVTFDTVFATTPVVSVSMVCAASVAQVRVWIGAVSTTGLIIFALREDNSGPYDVHWQATAPTQ